MSLLKAELEQSLADHESNIKWLDSQIDNYAARIAEHTETRAAHRATQCEIREALDKLYPPEPRVWDSIYDIPDGVLVREDRSRSPMYAKREGHNIRIALFPDVPSSWILLPKNHRVFDPFVEVLDA